MARRERFFVGPLEAGLQKNLKPWLIPDDAFERLNNAYIFRGRLRKRCGSYPIAGDETTTLGTLLASRMRISLGNTDINGDISGTVPGSIFKAGQMFSIGTETFMVPTTGTPVNLIRSTGSVSTATYNTTTGAFNITDSELVQETFFYPSEPVMALDNYEDTYVNFEPVIGFDTQFSYQFTGGAWLRLGTAVWTGDNSQFFWTTNYRGSTADTVYFYATNYKAADGIKYWNGTTWSTLNPAINVGGDTIETCRIIVPFKDRLVLLNVIEDVSAVITTFGNRCRYSQNGDPTAANAWREDLPGRGSYIDAPTKQQIVSAQLIRDRLIVFFERSTWELVYTGNEILPFRWQQINSELGVESPFSTVPFDRVAIGVGNVGIHACNGATVERIDNKIPDEVFIIRETNSATDRVHGVRDYFGEMVYWTFPTTETYSKKILAYNYTTGSWAFLDDSFTCFGYYQPSNSKVWGNILRAWETISDPWVDPQYNARFRSVIAGNQQGFVSVIDNGLARNAPALSISNINSTTELLTVVDHNLTTGDYILIENVAADNATMTGLNGNIYTVEVVSSSTIKILDSDGEYVFFTGNYWGQGTITRVSQIDILTKEYNFYRQRGETVNVNKVDFFVERTDNGSITVDPLVSSSSLSLISGAGATGALLGSGTLETSPYPITPLEASQSRLWHPVYCQVEGQSIQLRIYLSPSQMFNKNVSLSDMQIHAMIFHAKPGSSRLE